MPRTMEKKKLQELYGVNRLWPAISTNKKQWTENLCATVKYVIREENCKPN